MKLMAQQAPYPDVLAGLVAECSYRPGWTLRLVDDMERDVVDGAPVGRGLTLVITTLSHNSYHPDRGATYRVDHYFIVPAATYDYRSWRRWLFEQFCRVERHEAMEFFAIGNERPFAPSHAPGNDPYLVRELGTDEDQRTSFRGEMKNADE